MSRRARSSRSSRPRSRRSASAGPIFTALILAFALFAQAGLSALHGLSHAAARSSEAREVGGELSHSHLADAAEIAHPEHGSGDHDHHHNPSPGHRHEQTSESCDLCSLFAIGRLGWAAPSPTVLVGAVLAVEVRADVPSSRTLRPSLISAAPRGPPAA